MKRLVGAFAFKSAIYMMEADILISSRVEPTLVEKQDAKFRQNSLENRNWPHRRAHYVIL